MTIGIIQTKSSGWLYLINPSATQNKEEINKEMKKPNHGKLGKYMFFSDNKKLLIDVAKQILLKHNLFHAKVPVSDFPRPSLGFGFVLCIYDSSPKFKYELQNYADEEAVKYRYWKSDTETLEGKYSKEFLESKKLMSKSFIVDITKV